LTQNNYFGDVLTSQTIGLVLKKTKTNTKRKTEQKQTAKKQKGKLGNLNIMKN